MWKKLRNEEDLVNRSRAGDREALGDLIEHYGGALFGYAMKKMKNEANAEEVLGDTKLKIILKISTIEKTNFKSWAFQILDRTIIDFYRKKDNQTGELLHDDSDFLERFLSEDMEQVIIDNLSRDTISEDLVKRLKESGFNLETYTDFYSLVEKNSTDKCIVIFYLRYWKGLSDKDIREKYIDGYNNDRMYECKKKLRKLFNVKKSSGK